MRLIIVSWRYIKKYPVLAGVTLFSIVMASAFEGASFGMLIPLIQSMTAKSASLLEKIPFLEHLNFSFSSMDQAKLISFIFLFLLALLLIKNIFVYLSQILIAQMRFTAIRDLRVNLMNNLLTYDTKFFDGVKTGHIIGNISNEAMRMGDFIMAILDFITLAGRVFAYVLLLFLISWKFSVVIFILMIGVLIPIEIFMKRIKITGERISRAIAGYNHKLTEILNGMMLIKTCGTEKEEGRSFKAACDNVRDFMYKRSRYMRLIIPMSEVSIFGLIVLCFLILVNIAKIDVAASFPYIATFLLVLGRTLTQLNALNCSRSSAMGNFAAFANYESMCDKKGKMTIETGEKKLKKISDSIKFKNVNFSYTKGKEVLKGLNMQIPMGKITALVGASGAGKSTIANLIPRFYDTDSGEIRVDGVNLRDLALKEWRMKIGFVSQDVFIFNASVKDNISYGHANIPVENVIKATKAANAHDFIMNMPAGYDTILGERGVILSGGQKQRISIARAIIHDPEVLILDEATSSLDTGTERLITAAINRLTKNRTVIAIAHRFSTILHADNIIVLDKGRIIEEGRHADLIGKNGLYKKLCDVQFNMHDHVMESGR